MSAAEARIELVRLVAERADAVDAGLGDNDLFMADLALEIEARRAAYVGAAVTEIAILRADLSGALRG